MRSKVIGIVSLFAVTIFGLRAIRAADGPLPRTELAKRGKAATVPVLVDEEASCGTAFVVHPDGWFIINEHIAAYGQRSAKPMRIVLRPGEPDQKIATARIIRSAKEKNLALLKVDGVTGLPALTLGDSDRITELTELIGCGFPLGTQFGAGKGESPAVTVTISNVTSLRRRDGALIGIELDNAINQGNSGGPLLMSDGTVGGVILSGTGQAAHAIPAKIVREFLDAVDVSVVRPKLDRATLRQPTEFRADVVSLIPGTAKPTVELLLDIGDNKPRKFPMALQDGAYRAMAIPFPESSATQVTITARYGTSSIGGPIADREFKVGLNSVRLGEVRRIEPGKAILKVGTVASGRIAGLESVNLQMKGQLLTIDLTKADIVDIVSPPEPITLTCTVVATLGGKEIGRSSAVISRPTAQLSQPESTLEGERVTRKLPDVFSDVCAGAGGRYLLFGLPKQSKIALFDVSQAKVVHYFPAPDPGAKFAAGADKVVIAYPGQHIIQRWSLTTFEAEQTQTLPANLAIKSVLLGHSSQGPVIVDQTVFDLTSLKPTGVKLLDGPQRGTIIPESAVWTISGDGTVVGMTHFGGISPTGLFTVVLADGTAKSYHQHTTPEYVLPSNDGRLIFTSIGVFTNDLKPANEWSKQKDLHLVPAIQSNLYLGTQRVITGSEGGKELSRLERAIYTMGDSRPLAPVNLVSEDGYHGGLPPLPPGKGLWIIPEAKAIVTLPHSRDVIHLTRFDLDEVLQKSGTDYLFIVSNPPTAARKGDRYFHQLDVRSKRGSVRCKLDSGPQGMTVTPGGLIEWHIPANLADQSVPVIVSVADASGQEIFKSFTIKTSDK